MPGARLTRLTIGSTPYGQHGNPLANQLRSRVQYEIDCPLLDYSRRISVSVVNVAATIAGKPFLTFAIVGVSVFAFSALLTGICRGNLEYHFNVSSMQKRQGNLPALTIFRLQSIDS